VATSPFACFLVRVDVDTLSLTCNLSLSLGSLSAYSMMGTWFVIAVKPTIFEKTCSNAVEKYTFLEDSKKNDIDIDFKFNSKEDPYSSPLKSLPQKGWVQGENRLNSGNWQVSPQWPIKMPYQIIDVDDVDYSYCVIGFPSRAYCWIMARHPQMDEGLYNKLTQELVDRHKYSLDGLRRVPQIWTAEERQKRGLSKVEIPDSMLA
jgi:apolipoprotein D and lipocalin family protein